MRPLLSLRGKVSSSWFEGSSSSGRRTLPPAFTASVMSTKPSLLVSAAFALEPEPEPAVPVAVAPELGLVVLEPLALLL